MRASEDLFDVGLERRKRRPFAYIQLPTLAYVCRFNWEGKQAMPESRSASGHHYIFDQVFTVVYGPYPKPLVRQKLFEPCLGVCSL